MAKGKTEFNVSLESLQEQATAIAELDTKIGALTGSDTQVRKAIAEKVAGDNAEAISSVHDQVIAQLDKMDEAVLVGLVTRLQDSIKTSFQEKIDGFLDARVAEETKDTSGDVASLREARKEQMETFRALRTILDGFGVDTSSVPDPKRSSGRSGGGGSSKTGKNREGYQFTMDGKDRPPSQNSFSSLAFYSTLGCAPDNAKGEKQRWGAEQLKTFLAEQGVKYGDDDEWEVTLPTGTKIGARRVEATTDTEEASVEEPAA